MTKAADSWLLRSCCPSLHDALSPLKRCMLRCAAQEKRKRDAGKQSRGKNYVEEEKRRARDFGIFSGEGERERHSSGWGTQAVLQGQGKGLCLYCVGSAVLSAP